MMAWKLVLGLVIAVAGAVVLWHLAYSAIFLYIFIARASKKPGRGRLATRWFPGVARFVEEVRAKYDPSSLERLDWRMVRNTPIILRRLLVLTVLIFLGLVLIYAGRALT